MTFVYVPGSAAKLPFQVPQKTCCNCGSDQDVYLEETPLKETRYFGLAGIELTFTLDLPYCRRCVDTASRFPKGLFAKGLVSSIVFLLLMLAAILLPINVEYDVWSYLPTLLGCVSIALTFGFYALRRPAAPQTSYYQPVTLASVEQKFSGSVTGVELYCSNATFARDLFDLNREFVGNGSLKVRSA